MKERIESYKTMRQHRMEIREKLDLLQSNPRQAIEAEEQKLVDLTNIQETKEIFASWILHPENVGVGWFVTGCTSNLFCAFFVRVFF